MVNRCRRELSSVTTLISYDEALHVKNRFFPRLFLLAVLLYGPPSNGQEAATTGWSREALLAESGIESYEEPKRVSIGAQLHNRLENINTMILAEKYQEALHDIQGALDDVESLNEKNHIDFVKATLYQMMGYVHGLIPNVDLSIENFEMALETEALLPQEQQGVRYALANQYASKEDFEKAIEIMRGWFAYERNPFAAAFLFTGGCFSALEQYEDALPLVERAIELSDRPIESWYRMAVSLQFKLEKYEDAIATLKIMLTYWTQIPEYWEQLAGAYSEIGEDQAALDTTMVAYTNGMVRLPQRILSLVELNLAHGIPLTAGEILEKEMNIGVIPETERNLSILIQIWIGAREYDRAIAVIDKIVKISDASDYYMQAAQLSVQVGDWSNAADSAKKALDAGAERVNSLMMIGTAYAEQGMYEQAIDAFENAREIGDGKERENAEQWIEFVAETRDYQALLSAAQ
jgi:tetratricopeptide (TPR) repeat protein